jgi:hypothetical protein
MAKIAGKIVIGRPTTEMPIELAGLPGRACSISRCSPGSPGFVSKLSLTTSAFAASPPTPSISQPGSQAREHGLEVLCA